MTPEVKQRIDQIRQGIVPEGYKKTKTDIVPADWKESPIGKYIREYTEKTTIPNQYPVLTSARTGLMLQTDYYSNRQVTTEDNVGYNVLPYGYITFRSRSDDGRFRFNENRIIERGIISYFYPVFSFSEEVCHEYVLYLLNFSIYRRMYPYAEGTAQQVLSLKKLGQLKYSLPLVAEQKKIVEILVTQDKAIELQGRKIEELKRFKKGCLEKMFPRKGQKVPEKRFPGFTDDWEQRKAIDIADYSKGNGYSKGDLTDAGTPIILYGRLYTKYQFAISEVDTFAVPRNGAVYSQGNEVIVPASGETAEDIARASAVEKSGVLLGGDLNILRPFDFINPLFLALAISNGEPQKELAKKAQGKSVVHIHNTDIQEVTIAYPSRTEQDRIVSVFRQLDNLITLHQRKLEEMKRQKKALMQLLLTGIVRVQS